ncbi:hypothetical protein ACFY12_17580 [Streptomyces sp. NPDC001339]|uniref:hypothetical protein n=1 Tax=Streptomyces sp. NPDC001339 TaxID=3364563 RepID=UPI003684F28F
MNNDQAPATLPAPDEARTGEGFAFAGRLVIGLLLFAGAGFTALFAPFLAMASDGCYGGDARLICTTGGQNTVASLPLFAAFAAAVLTVVGLGSRRTAGAACLVAAPCVLALAWVVSLAIAGS